MGAMLHCGCSAQFISLKQAYPSQREGSLLSPGNTTEYAALQSMPPGYGHAFNLKTRTRNSGDTKHVQANTWQAKHIS